MSKPTGTSYPIRTLLDFTSVPADRMDACLADFKNWVAIVRQIPELGVSVEAVDDFTWIDDGQRNMSFRILPPEGQP